MTEPEVGIEVGIGARMEGDTEVVGMEFEAESEMGAWTDAVILAER